MCFWFPVKSWPLDWKAVYSNRLGCPMKWPEANHCAHRLSLVVLMQQWGAGQAQKAISCQYIFVTFCFLMIYLWEPFFLKTIPGVSLSLNCCHLLAQSMSP
jgi:hypothetical protein